MKGSLGTARFSRLLKSAAAVSILFGGAVPALAQQNSEARLNKVEAEVRALQRKVFPGADGKFFQPEITSAPAPSGAAPGQPATTPVTDLLTRMDAVEAQMARLTAQVEQDTNRINQLEARLGQGAQPGSATPAPALSVPPPLGQTTSSAQPAPSQITQGQPPAPQVNLNAMTGGASAKSAALTPAASKPAKPAAPSAARIEAVKAIAKPQTDDPGDDEYSYGYRLWEAKFYPETEQQLKLFLEKYPKHPRASWGRNLLGRAYLDEGNPGEAAKWFLQNYQADKRGDRAPDSLLYLAITMKQMKDTKRACIALAEFSQTYAAETAGRLKSLYDSTRDGLSCG